MASHAHAVHVRRGAEMVGEGGKRLHIALWQTGKGRSIPTSRPGVFRGPLLLPFPAGAGDVSSVLQVPGMSEPDRDTQAGLSPGARPPPFFSLISTSRGSPISR